MKENTIKILLVDDHQLVRSGIKMIVEKFINCQVISEASNGKEILEQLTAKKSFPDIILMDISMPLMNGIEATAIISREYPSIKVIALTVHNEMNNIANIIKAGARAYLLKDSSAEILEHTIQHVYKNDYYYDKFVVEQMMKFGTSEEDNDLDIEKLRRHADEAIKWLTPREIEFIKLCCSELTYKEIASEMKISQNTVNNYRENVFDKLEIRSRVGIVLFAINHRLFTPKFL